MHEDDVGPVAALRGVDDVQAERAIIAARGVGGAGPPRVDELLRPGRELKAVAACRGSREGRLGRTDQRAGITTLSSVIRPQRLATAVTALSPERDLSKLDGSDRSRSAPDVRREIVGKRPGPLPWSHNSSAKWRGPQARLRAEPAGPTARRDWVPCRIQYVVDVDWDVTQKVRSEAVVTYCVGTWW